MALAPANATSPKARAARRYEGRFRGHCFAMESRALNTRDSTATRTPQKAYRTAFSSSNCRRTKDSRKMMQKEGRTVPRVAAAAPAVPATL